MGGKRGPKPVSAAVRFAAKCRSSSSGCIEWIGATNNSGYGTFYASPGRYTMAHRWSFEREFGPISQGLYLDHLCRNTSCVNPHHLEAVTQQVNLLRGKTISACNAAKTHCPHGHPYSGNNLYAPAGAKQRYCKTCMTERDRNRSVANRKET